ncbi:MAG: hypothetical protein U0136_02670 [Bdellovibrionota bacterium]
MIRALVPVAKPSGPMGNDARPKIRYFLYPALLVIGVGACLSYFGISPTSRPSTDSATVPNIQGKPVEIGKDYYVSVALVELTEADDQGNRWDSFSESGPDITVQIAWNGSKIYESTVKRDTFVAKWSNAELNLRDIAISGLHTSMDDVIRAARINVKAGESIEIRVFDKDLLSDTLAGTKTFLMSDLREGDTTFTYDTAGIKRLTLRVADMSGTVDPLR